MKRLEGRAAVLVLPTPEHFALIIHDLVKFNAECIESKKDFWRGAAIAQWICLRIPSCRLGSNPKHTIYTFIKLFLNCDM